MEQTKWIKQMRFGHIVFAFGHFAGKALRVLDCADALTVEDIKAMEVALDKIAAVLGAPASDGCPDAMKLAIQIRKELHD